ncbi:MAG: serine/threonine-protein kinase [Leptolyngbyaceae bacterium]|nr:serine/threonine-protein kinase [Leptolyngbyaceae bacterium]
MPEDPNIGRILSNRYEIVSILGQGSMGRVYGAKDKLLGGVFVAVKFLSQNLTNQRVLDRFEREAMICALLGQRSINIIRVTDYGVDQHATPYYVMEYLEGSPLIDRIKTGPIPIPQFLGLVRQICAGLQCAHRGIEIDNIIHPIIHRDIKPSNIFITKYDSLSPGELVKVLDFGIAKTLQEDGEDTKCFMGTLAYASPEQMEGLELDGRSDIYSLGIVMFQMLTGKLPVSADTHTFGAWYKAHREYSPRSLIDAAGPLLKQARTVKARDDMRRALKSIESVIMSCLEKNPNSRPQSAGAIFESLKSLEERFAPNIELAGELERFLKRNKPSLPHPDRKPSSRKPSSMTPEDFCRLHAWPKDKPIADIVFPHIIQTSRQPLLTLWSMLPREAIEQLTDYTAHNKFMFMENPHPVLLWVTVLYSAAHGPRWFPCYLDLKKKHFKDMLNLLIEAKHYRVLLFSRDYPQACSRVITLTITEPAARVSSDLVNKQSEQLKKFAALAELAPTTQANLSKSFLRDELDKIKPGIVERLQAIR